MREVPDFNGLTAFGAYIPRLRLERKAIAASMAWANTGLGSFSAGARAVAAWDEDAITMATEAARDALAGNAATGVSALYLASTSAPFADRSNAAVMAGALDLPADVHSLDLGGSHRCATSALIAALTSRSAGEVIVAAADTSAALPGSQQEISAGDAAAAMIVGSQDPIARVLGIKTLTTDFVDHWRAASQRHAYNWEERWVREEGYLKLVPQTVAALLQDTGIAAADIAHAIFPSRLKGMEKALLKAIGLGADRRLESASVSIGFAGAAEPLLLLVAALERAKPGEKILLTAFGSGCDAILFEATEALVRRRPLRGVSGWLSEGSTFADYARFLALKGEIDVDWGPRSEFGNKFAPSVQARAGRSLQAFIGGRDKATGAIQFPKTPVAVAPGAGARAEYEDVRLADEPAKIVAATADWLTFHPDPPFYFGLVQFDNGARVAMEFVDVCDRSVAVGTPVEMRFRIKEIDKARGYRHYFWKAVPKAEAAVLTSAEAD